MAKPTPRCSSFNDEPLILKEFLKSLNARRVHWKPLGITFIGALTAKEALQLIERDGDVQIVIVDDKLYAVVEGGRRQAHRKRKRQGGAAQPADERAQAGAKDYGAAPELDLYILIGRKKRSGRRRAVRPRPSTDTFTARSATFRGIYRILNAQIAERARTPFYDALRAYVLQRRTPGIRPATRVGLDAWQPVGQRSLRVHG